MANDTPKTSRAYKRRGDAKRRRIASEQQAESHKDLERAAERRLEVYLPCARVYDDKQNYYPGHNVTVGMFTPSVTFSRITGRKAVELTPDDAYRLYELLDKVFNTKR